MIDIIKQKLSKDRLITKIALVALIMSMVPIFSPYLVKAEEKEYKEFVPQEAEDYELLVNGYFYYDFIEGCLEEINDFRAKNNLAPVEYNWAFQELVDHRAVQTAYHYAHKIPGIVFRDGIFELSHQFQNEAYDYSQPWYGLASENIGVTGLTSHFKSVLKSRSKQMGKEIAQGFIDSPGHCEMILFPENRYMTLGTFITEDWLFFSRGSIYSVIYDKSTNPQAFYALVFSKTRMPSHESFRQKGLVEVENYKLDGFYIDKSTSAVYWDSVTEKLRVYEYNFSPVEYYKDTAYGGELMGAAPISEDNYRLELKDETSDSIDLEKDGIVKIKDIGETTLLVLHPERDEVFFEVLVKVEAEKPPRKGTKKKKSYYDVRFEIVDQKAEVIWNPTYKVLIEE